MSAAIVGLTVLASGGADAQQRAVAGGGARISFPSQSHNFSWEGRHGGFHGHGDGFGGVFIVEREVPVIVEREVVREVPAVAPPAPAPPRKPYVIGSSYASLPGSCMKLIEEGVSYYYCDGDWYRQVGQGRSITYKAVTRKL